jgi:glycosyltransferase involved in cell wall biosynthesis
MMRIVSIAPYRFLPARKGGEIHIANSNAHLARYCRLTLVSVQANQPEAPLPYELWPLFSNSRLRYLNIFYCRPLAKAIRQKEVQLLWIEHPYMGWMALLLQALTGRGYVVHSHNIEAARFRSLGKWWWPLLQAYEKWVHRKAAHSFFITREDADTAIRQYGLTPQRVSVAPYGITPPNPLPNRTLLRPQICAMHGIAAHSTIYCFNGALGYPPNQQAVRKIIEIIYPLLEKAADFPYVILVSGKGLPSALVEKIAQTNGKIIYTGFVPNINDYLAIADIFINPVTEGGGVKTKVLEALAFNNTVVSAASGAAGINTAVCGAKLEIAPDNDWQQFVTYLLQRNAVAEATPPSFFEYYSNDRIARDASATMQALLARH